MRNLDSIDITELRQAIYEFLHANGGMNNGYLTYVEGMVGASGIKWSTPAAEDLTARQIKVLGEQLAKELNRLRDDCMPDEVICEVEAKHIEWGCYVMSIILRYPSRTVRL